MYSSSVVLNFKLDASEYSPTFYYAKRGCTADPDDGIRTGMAAVTDRYIVPAGYTGISQYNERTKESKGNKFEATEVSTAQEFVCFSCNTTINIMSFDVPTYSDIVAPDNTCWETYDQQVKSVSKYRVLDVA